MPLPPRGTAEPGRGETTPGQELNLSSAQVEQRSRLRRSRPPGAGLNRLDAIIGQDVIVSMIKSRQMG